MKSIGKIFLLSSVFALASCQMQDSAEIVYNLDDYIGESQPQQTSTPEPKGQPVVIEESVPESEDYNITKNNPYQVPSTIVEERIEPVIVPQAEEHTVIQTQAREPEQNSIIKISGATHNVKKGDTLYSLSRRYDIPIMPIIIANNLEAPYALSSGQIIKIPEASFHVVQPSDTLYSISRKYGVDMSELTKINGLTEPFSISKGQKLQIPFPTYHAGEVALTLPQQEKVVAPTPEEPKRAAIIPQEEVVENPNLVRNEAPEEGGPASLQKTHKNIFAFKESGEAVVNKTQDNVKAASKPEELKKAEPAVEKTQVTAAKIAKVDSRGVSKSGFIWPVEGKIVKAFGSQQGNEYSDGINIAASSGTEVKASSNGRVVYTGDSLKSFGNLVIVKHDNGLLSAYAHLGKINVKKDEKISRGQIIGNVGATGKVDSPQLYFAVRKGKDAIDPKRYLP